MLIEHYKKTPIARAPDEIVRATNDYTKHQAVLNKTGLQKPDLYHYHNKTKPGQPYARNQIMQYHSEPERVDLTFPGVKLVLAQYHCLLPEYQDFKRVRNIIPIYDDAYSPQEQDTDIIKVGYSPSHMNTTIKGHFDKGLEVTMAILKKVKQAYPKKFDFDLITGVQPIECMTRKKKCNVIIDEVVTDSYHKCTLEGLSLGKATICSMSPDMERILLLYCDRIPILNVWSHSLEAYLIYLIEKGVDYVNKVGKESRAWMEKNWKPSDIIQEYIKIYEGVL